MPVALVLTVLVLHEQVRSGWRGRLFGFLHFRVSHHVSIYLTHFVDISRFSLVFSCSLYLSVPILGSQDGVEINVGSLLQV